MYIGGALASLMNILVTSLWHPEQKYALFTWNRDSQLVLCGLLMAHRTMPWSRPSIPVGAEQVSPTLPPAKVIKVYLINVLEGAWPWYSSCCYGTT